MSTSPSLRLGSGILTWPPAERELSRFGTVCLRIPDTHTHATFTPGAWLGVTVHLCATVTRLRAPVMPTNRLLGIAPATPQRGREYVLGHGALFVLSQNGTEPTAIGIVPTGVPMRPDRWMDAQTLYNLHNHEVVLEAKTPVLPGALDTD